MIKAAIFDMDGLMIDSDSIISRAYEDVLKEYGKEPQLDVRGIVHTPGISAVDNWKNLTKIYDIGEDIGELVKKKSRLHAEYMREGVKVMPGLFDLLALLDARDLKMAIASSSVRELVEAVVAQLGIEQYFDVVVAGGEVVNGKPAPDIFLKAATGLSIDPGECVVFEDAINGVCAAKAGRMKCIAIPAADSLNDEAFNIADIVLSSLEDVNWDAIEQLGKL